LSKPQKKIITASIANQLVNVKKVNMNVDQELIMITEDKAELCLRDYLDNVEKRGSWATPLAIFLTVVVTMVTTSFKQFIVDAEVWQAIFIIVGGISFVWLVWSLYKRPKAKKIKDVINGLKAQTEQ
jgi:Flp pilus assembly protein TadB